MAYIKKPSNRQKQEWEKKAKENENAAYEMIKGIAEGYKKNPEQLVEYFQFASKFYKYSPNNVALIYAQNEGATFVQSYKEWKDMGTPVKRGATGLKILVPVKVTYLKIGENQIVQLSKATNEQRELYKNGKLESFQKDYYKIGNVFDISQTEFPKEKYPEMFSMGYSSDLHKKITNGLIRFSEKEIGCPVTYEDLSSIAIRGFYNREEHRIALNHLMADTMNLSTMSHELGHALLHNHKTEKSISQIEFEEDAISIMLQKQYGIELTDARKSHLASSFKDYMKECEEKIETENLKKDIDQMIQESFREIFMIYRENFPQIQKYIDEELNADLKKIFLINGIPEGQFQKWMQEGALLRKENNQYIFQKENARLTLVENQFLEDIPSENAYWNQGNSELFITQNKFEFLRNIENDKAVLLIENEADFQECLDLVKENSFQKISFGAVHQAMEEKFRKEILTGVNPIGQNFTKEKSLEF
ncbi:Uncharacterised protein [Tyzzerella nexilis]|uniref:ImmA/IrrE family metallo-endopeptidase n=1 Tax=[Clostridium] nexile TaxID=29361 RepID=A0A6N2VTX7_9FIRM